MKDEKEIHPDSVVVFYDPHPGFMGAAIPLPDAVKKAADELDGQALSLREAVSRIQAITSGRVEADARFKFIGLRLGDSTGNYIAHYFRVISFR